LSVLTILGSYDAYDKDVCSSVDVIKSKLALEDFSTLFNLFFIDWSVNNLDYDFVRTVSADEVGGNFAAP
jgi:hypothetical protein